MVSVFDNQAGEEDSLRSHLQWQLDCSRLSDIDHELGLAIIDAIGVGREMADEAEQHGRVTVASKSSSLSP